MFVTLLCVMLAGTYLYKNMYKAIEKLKKDIAELKPNPGEQHDHVTKVLVVETKKLKAEDGSVNQPERSAATRPSERGTSTSVLDPPEG